jgi:hypothetical protein
LSQYCPGLHIEVVAKSESFRLPIPVLTRRREAQFSSRRPAAEALATVISIRVRSRQSWPRLRPGGFRRLLPAMRFVAGRIGAPFSVHPKKPALVRAKAGVQGGRWLRGGRHRQQDRERPRHQSEPHQGAGVTHKGLVRVRSPPRAWFQCRNCASGCRRNAELTGRPSCWRLGGVNAVAALRPLSDTGGRCLANRDRRQSRLAGASASFPLGKRGSARSTRPLRPRLSRRRRGGVQAIPAEADGDTAQVACLRDISGLGRTASSPA